MGSLGKFIVKEKNGKRGRVRRIAATRRMLKLPWRRKQKEMEKAGEKQSRGEDGYYKRKPERRESLQKGLEPCLVSNKMSRP